MAWMDLGCTRAVLRMHKALSKRTHNEHVMEVYRKLQSKRRRLVVAESEV